MLHISYCLSHTLHPLCSLVSRSLPPSLSLSFDLTISNKMHGVLSINPSHSNTCQTANHRPYKLTFIICIVYNPIGMQKVFSNHLHDWMLCVCVYVLVVCCWCCCVNFISTFVAFSLSLTLALTRPHTHMLYRCVPDISNVIICFKWHCTLVQKAHIWSNFHRMWYW